MDWKGSKLDGVLRRSLRETSECRVGTSEALPTTRRRHADTLAREGRGVIQGDALRASSRWVTEVR